MKRSPWKMAFGAVILLSVLGLAGWRILAPFAQEKACDLSSGPCVVMLGSERAEVDLAPRRPVPGEVLTFSLRSLGNGAFELGSERGKVDFSMPGMDMGENLMDLELVSPDLLEGRIALPACPMGHSLWQASIQIADRPPVDVNLHVGD